MKKLFKGFCILVILAGIASVFSDSPSSDDAPLKKSVPQVTTETKANVVDTTKETKKAKETTKAETKKAKETKANTEKVGDHTVEVMSATMYVTASELNVRKSPDSSGKVLGSIAEGKSAKVTGKVDNGWYQIEYKKGKGYVSGKYLSSTEPVKETKSTKSTEKTKSSSDSETYVWVTKTGEKYHRIPNCGNTRNASQKSLSEARKKCSPCEKCY